MIQMEPALEAAGVGAQMLLQVHDELIFEVAEAEVDDTFAVVRRTMENAALPALEMKVPLRVDMTAADNWDEAH
jgi:DNA polymerase-1